MITKLFIVESYEKAHLICDDPCWSPPITAESLLGSKEFDFFTMSSIQFDFVEPLAKY